MKWWYNIQRYFYRKALNEALRQTKELRSIINLPDAQTIGILYDSSDADNDILITRFAEQLKRDGKQVEILGFINDNKTDHKADIKVMNTAHISWCLVPVHETALDFARKRFDLLLCCFTREILPLEYIAAISRARWRVGVYDERKTALYDFMINIGGRRDLSYLLSIITSYLNKIHYDAA
ncbi:MAG: hypothetical protein NZM35_06405 [Chitinophagales bacterium]|nr:hypothetical protein [Chitinophagales bacterium]MDW8418828.1 hypothetical protein [Chitinophagales bacterium]